MLLDQPALKPGDKLGAYEIVEGASAGAGWAKCTARTTRGSRRDVALKVLSPENLADNESRQKADARGPGGIGAEPSEHRHGV